MKEHVLRLFSEYKNRIAQMYVCSNYLLPGLAMLCSMAAWKLSTDVNKHATRHTCSFSYDCIMPYCFLMQCMQYMCTI
jgi:hypothetical protein